MTARPTSFRKKAIAATAAFAMAAGSALNASPASAQDGLSPAQCMSAKAATLGTLEMFKGKMSAEFARSLGEFSKSCDLKVKFNRVPGQDDKAWDMFRAQITNIRISATATPATLAQR